MSQMYVRHSFKMFTKMALWHKGVIAPAVETKFKGLRPIHKKFTQSVMCSKVVHVLNSLKAVTPFQPCNE